jgi:hypothetical protein
MTMFDQEVTMLGKDQEWMSYIDAEVKSACTSKGWRHQIRRELFVRGKPVSESGIEDYEWKLVPDSDPQLPEEAPPTDYEGVYYVLCFDKPNQRFLFQHDTTKVGVWSPEWERSTYTEIRLLTLGRAIAQLRGGARRLPPSGWLRDHLLDLIARFRPNRFSST